MKKIILFSATLIMCILLLSACGCQHQWSEANCVSPKTCALCGETEGEKLSHQWADATCTEPKTCSLCEETQGDVLDHQWEAANCLTPETCAQCGATQGTKLEHIYSDWSFDIDTMSRSCGLCGETETAAIDYVLYLNSVLRGRWDCEKVFDKLAYNVYGPQVPFIEFLDDDSIRFFESDTISHATMEFVSLEEFEGKNQYHFLLSSETVNKMDFWYIPEDDALFSLIFEFDRLGEEVEGYLEIITGKWTFDSIGVIYDERLKNYDHSGYSIEFFEDGTFSALLDERIDGHWSILKDDIIYDEKGANILLFALYDGDFYNTTIFMNVNDQESILGITRSLKETVYFTKENSK